MATARAVLRLALALIALAAAPASARVVDFPLSLDHAFVRQRMIETLFDGEGETTRVWRDASHCNDVMLAHPRLSARDGKLHVVADFDAKLGAPVGNWCVNATRRKGILDAALEARLHPTVPIVEFRVVGSELLDPDGKKRLTGALWDWVRAQVHPHLETMRIDLFQPVSELKTFLPVLFPGSDFARVKKLIDSLALSDVVVSAQAISVRVRLDVPPRDEQKASEVHQGETGTTAPSEPALTPEEIARWDSAWQSWDGFLTFLVKHSSKDAGDESREQLRDAVARRTPGHVRDPRVDGAAQRGSREAALSSDVEPPRADPAPDLHAAARRDRAALPLPDHRGRCVHRTRAARARLRRRAQHERAAPDGAHDRALAARGSDRVQRVCGF